MCAWLDFSNDHEKLHLYSRYYVKVEINMLEKTVWCKYAIHITLYQALI